MSFEKERVAGQESGMESTRGGESIRDRIEHIRERIGERIGEQMREHAGSEGGQNVGGYERVVSGVGGAALVWLGMRSKSVGGALIALAGGAMLYRGATGRCPVYRRFGIDTAGESLSHGVEVERSITVSASPDEVYRFLRDVSNHARFMSHVESAQELGGGRARWEARGVDMAWEARMVEDVPGRRIVWQSEPGADMELEHEVRFEQAPGGRGTEVRVRMRFQPPSGRVAAALARFLRGISKVKLGQDLHRMKQILETGERTTSAMRGEERRESSYRAQRTLPEEMRSDVRSDVRGQERGGNTGSAPGVGSHR